MNRLAASILLAFSTVGASYAQAPAAPVAAVAPLPAYNLEADVTRVMKAFDVPGISIAVVKDGKVIAA
jgi:CubicO group peptidase (beta-lactamase class C family)